jgi:serine/threonine protein kinase
MKPGAVALFHGLADLSPQQRARFLARHPSGPDTRAEVEDLLAYDSTETGLLMPVIAAEAAAALQSMDAVGARCGAFQLLSVIGRGGMGVVYLAERVDGEIRQRAAVKLLHPGYTDALRERFLHEREILAALSHPNIAHLLDAGRLDDGQPYLAMEYVAGQPIHRYSEGLDAGRKLQLFLRVCGAVEYLHRNGLVHRDLKPGNILVTAEGEPKLLDFGISKMLELSGDVTATCLRMLTPNYASPEQISGGAAGKPSDIYSLGVMLRELLGGEGKGDLETVIRTATRPEPEERYASVEELAGDLRAVLEFKPIRARGKDWIYRTRKLVRRHLFAIAMGAAVAATVLTAGTVVGTRSRPASGTTLMAHRLTANTTEVPIQAAAISPKGEWIAYSDGLGVHLRDTATGETRLLPQTADHVFSHWMPDGSRLVTNVAHGASLQPMIVSISGEAPVPVSEPWVYSPGGKRRAVSPKGEQRIVAENADGSELHEIWKTAEKQTLNDFAWSPRGEEIAVLRSRGNVSTLEVIDVVRGRKTVVVGEARKLSIGGIVWTGPSRIVLATLEISGVNSYNSNLWEVRLNARRELTANGLRQLTAWTDFPIQPGSLSTDGKRLTFVRSFVQRDVYIGRMDAARVRMEHPRRMTLELGDDYPTAWTRDSKSVILASDRAGDIKIFVQDLDRQSAEPLVDLPGRQILARTAPDGRSVLFCSIVPKERSCRLMRAPLGGGKPELVDTIPQIADFRCSPSGRCVVTQMRGQSPGHIVSELDPLKGKGREIYREADSFSGTPDISPDGNALATVSRTTITVRSFATGEVLREIRVKGVSQIFTLDYAPDGKGFYTGEFRQTESRQLYVDRSGRATLLWRQPGRAVIWGVPSPDGKNLALLMYTTDANVYLVDAI